MGIPGTDNAEKGVASSGHQDTKKKIAVIGAGFMSQVAHLEALRNSPTATAGILVDSRERFRGQVAERFAIPEHYSKIEGVLEDPTVDGVVVSMPRRTIAPIVHRLLLAGKNVLSEKPMAYTRAEALTLVVAARSSGATYLLGFMKRHDPGVRLFRDKLFELRRNSELGEILHVRVEDYCAEYAVPVPPHIRSDVSRPVREAESPAGPGFLDENLKDEYEYTLNVSSHALNLIGHLLQDDLAVEGFRVRRGTLQQALFSASNFDMQIETGRGRFGRWHQVLNVIFEKGFLRLDLPSPLNRQSVARTVLQSKNGLQLVEPEAADRKWSFFEQMDHFAECIDGAAAPATNGEDGLHTIATIEELWKRAVVL